jgi:hypothetical protein
MSVFKRFGRLLNGGAIIAFALGLVCCALPNLQVIMHTTLKNVVFAPLYLLIAIHIAGIYWLVSLPLAVMHTLTGSQHYLSLRNEFTLIAASCMILWLTIIWVWTYYAIFARNAPMWRLNQFRWLAPLLLVLLSLLWISHIPLSLTFACHRPALEQLADQVISASPEKQEFIPPRKLGVFDVRMGVRQSEVIAAIEIDSFWAFQGFVRNLSRKPGNLPDRTRNLTSGSAGDDELFYWEDGWYLVQNLFD